MTRITCVLHRFRNWWHEGWHLRRCTRCGWTEAHGTGGWTEVP